MTRTFLALALAVCAFVVSGEANAAAAFKNWEATAPEALEVTVLSVRQGEKTERPMGPNCTQIIREFTVTAKVDVVLRSASGVQPGRTITFHNSTVGTGPCVIVGGSFGATVNGGDRAGAYLRAAPDGAFATIYVEKLR